MYTFYLFFNLLNDLSCVIDCLVPWLGVLISRSRKGEVFSRIRFPLSRQLMTEFFPKHLFVIESLISSYRITNFRPYVSGLNLGLGREIIDIKILFNKLEKYRVKGLKFIHKIITVHFIHHSTYFTWLIVRTRH